MKRLILIGLLTLASHVFADSAAKVLFTQKDVTVNGHALSRGASLGPGDQIVTAANSAANIQYSNGTLVNIGENSTYKILAYSPSADIQIKAELSNGRVEIENKGKIKETLKTPIVSLAILGTHIIVDVTSSKMTYVQVIEGLVLARNEFLRPGDSVRVTSDRIEPITIPSAAATGTTGAGVVTYVNTVQTTGSSTGGGTTQATNSAQASISLTCTGPAG